MRLKDCYSLNVDELFGERSTIRNSPAQIDDGVKLEFVQENCRESLNIFEALADYLVARNCTQDMARQVEVAENALDARNAEAQRQNDIIIANYAERLNKFLETKRQEFELETQRIELESVAQVENLHNDREKQRAQLNALTKILAFYRASLEQMQKFLMELEGAPELYVTRNKFYFQAKEDCRIKIRRINDVIKKIGEVA